MTTSTIPVIISTEYHANTPSTFAILNSRYVGCQIYPSSRNYPTLEYWSNATSSDSDRGFTIVYKSFTDAELNQIEILQNVIDNLSKLIPSQPKWDFIPRNFKVKRGAAYNEYHAKSESQNIAIKEYFESIKIYDQAITKASTELRNILAK